MGSGHGPRRDETALGVVTQVRLAGNQPWTSHPGVWAAVKPNSEVSSLDTPLLVSLQYHLFPRKGARVKNHGCPVSARQLMLKLGN